MKLRFKSVRGGLQTYHDGPANTWRNGDEQEVPEAEAERRLSDFPEYFEKADQGPVENKADQGPTENKSVNPDEVPPEESSDEGAGDDDTEDDESESEEEEVPIEVKSAYTRALRKMDEGKELTEKEQDAYERLDPDFNDTGYSQ